MTNTLPTGFYPFWFWNDRLTTDEIRWQVAEMARQGVRGFFIHSRQGLAQPYLSEAFFEMMDVAVAAAEEHGLVVHLYDEYPYPSGVAGGQVTLGQPQYHATELIQRTYDVPGGPLRIELPAGKVLSVVAFPVADGRPDWSHGVDLADHVGPLLVVDSYRETGLTRYNQKRYFASRPTPVLEAALPEGPHRIFASVQAVVTHHKYWGHFADVFNPDAVTDFMRQTHERYLKRYGEKFGTTIHSIFVDETQPGWSARLPDAFRAEYDYDLATNMPALLDETHPDHVRVTYDLHRLRYKLFCRSWEEPISAWCRTHGLAYSGEKPSLRMAQLRYMDIPGCEPGHTKAGAPLDLLGPHLRQNAKATASAAYFYGKAGSLDECYHSLGWSGTLQDAKLMADGQLLAGIKYLVPHGFFYSTHALRKHDAPPTFFFQAPYWPLFGKLAEHVDRIGRLFEGTHIDAQILVVEPSSGIPSRVDVEAYVRLHALLMENHLDFHFADTDILQEGRIESVSSSLQAEPRTPFPGWPEAISDLESEIASAHPPSLAMTGEERAQVRLRVADLAIKLIIVPPMRVIEPPLAEWLAAFEAVGGWVIRCAHDFAPSDMLSTIRAIVGPSLGVRVAGAEAPAVQVVKRAGGGRTLWFVLNAGSEALTVALDSGGFLREIPLEPERSPRLERHDGQYVRDLYPFESFMLEACDEEYNNESAGLNESSTVNSVNPSDSVSYRPATLTIPLRGTARIHPLNPNLLRLAEWRMSILEEDAPAQTAVVQAAPLSDQLERGGFRFAPRVQRYFGHEPELDWPPLHVRYECAFDLPGGWNPPSEPGSSPRGPASRWPVEFVMEPGSIIGNWRLWVNDSDPLTAADLRPTSAHVRGSLGVDITAALRPGPNTLRVEITDARSEGGLLNPLYLAGDFGVALNPLRLIERPETGGFETHEANGLPFYAGVIEYALDFALRVVPQGERVRADLVTDAPFHDACAVSINAGPWRALAWEPRSLELPAAELHPDRNEIRVKVYTTLIRAFEGQWFDHDAHCYREIG